MLSAAYPENFNELALFPKFAATFPKIARWCCSRRIGGSREPPGLERKNSGLLRKNSNSRVWV